MIPPERDLSLLALLLSLAVLGGIGLGWALSARHAVHPLRVEAVERGAAEWAVQPDGSTDWRWTE